MLAAVLIGLAASAAAEPMDLRNPEPRFVDVRFEISPAELPGQVDSVYGAPLAAWLEPEAGATRRRVTISATAIEARLVHEQNPVPGSFSDFVWSFDVETGHVHSAALEGAVVLSLDWGVATTRAKARLRFQMDTFGIAGYRKPRSVLGQPVNYVCDPAARRDCVRVQPHRYDPATGYVMAVGPIDVENAILEMRTFSTLGEALFSERKPVERAPGSRQATLGVPVVLHSQR